jgi:hypothetical protein
LPQTLTSATTDLELVSEETIPDNIYEKVNYYAKKYDVSADRMHATIVCESNYDVSVQSKHIRPDGSREQSYGIAQWYIPAGNKKLDGTPFTKEEALNPDIALENMAWYFSQGKSRLWTCAR